MNWSCKKEASSKKIAPLIVDSWICTDPSIGVIIMPVLKKTLESIRYAKDIPRKTETIVKKI